MQCFHFETMRRWLRARLRRRGYEVRDDDTAVDDILGQPEFTSIADVIRLDDTRLDRIAHLLGYSQSIAA